MFVKVFKRIHDSSVANDHMLRFVFMDMLILADRDGVVDMTVEAVSRRTNVPVETVREMIRRLCEPDPTSNTPDHEGRRLMPLTDEKPWGWRIVNFEKYRNIRNTDELREQTRERVKRFRAKQKEAITTANSGPQPDPLEVPDNLKTQEFMGTWLRWMTVRRGMKRVKEWVPFFRGQLDWLSEMGPELAVQCLKKSILGNYQGLIDPRDSMRTNGGSSTAPHLRGGQEIKPGAKF